VERHDDKGVLSVEVQHDSADVESSWQQSLVTEMGNKD